MVCELVFYLSSQSDWIFEDEDGFWYSQAPSDPLWFTTQLTLVLVCDIIVVAPFSIIFPSLIFDLILCVCICGFWFSSGSGSCGNGVIDVRWFFIIKCDVCSKGWSSRFWRLKLQYCALSLAFPVQLDSCTDIRWQVFVLFSLYHFSLYFVKIASDTWHSLQYWIDVS